MGFISTYVHKGIEKVPISTKSGSVYKYRPPNYGTRLFLLEQFLGKVRVVMSEIRYINNTDSSFFFLAVDAVLVYVM